MDKDKFFALSYVEMRSWASKYRITFRNARKEQVALETLAKIGVKWKGY